MPMCRVTFRTFAPATLALAVGLFAVRQPIAAEPAKADPTFEQKIKPFLGKYCNSCHNGDKQAGGVALDVYVSEAHAKKDRATWETVKQVMATGEMPPKKKAQPPTAEKEFVIDWIGNALTKVDCTAPKDPGRVTLRRLNRAEYNNTVRDLCGVDFKPADDFPSDDVGYGFDNIGDILSVQPILLEKYLVAADKILEQAVVPPRPVPATKQRFNPQALQTRPREARIRDGERRRVRFITRGEVFLEQFNIPADGEYAFRVVGYRAAGNGEPKVTFRVGDREVGAVTVTATGPKSPAAEVRVQMKAGTGRLTAEFVNPSPDGTKEPLAFELESIEVDGPIGGGFLPTPESTKRIVFVTPANEQNELAAAQTVLSAFARKAYRRPVKPEELQRLMKLYQVADGQGDGFEQALKLPLKAVLASPHFLFRVEDDPKEPAAARRLDDHELAARLSYFLWSSMPDAELSAAADQNQLRKPEVLAAQVKRMLRDPKSDALTANFAGQWLQLRSVATADPDPQTYPSWDEDLRAAMVRETEMFFDHVVKNDRPVTDFLDADYTFVNERLARHYDIPNVRGRDFQKVKLPNDRRGGVLTQASVLTVTSNPTRTSPVKRGKYVLENVLGTPPPPPAPDVPELPPTAQLKGTVRQQMEQHRADPNCASCHARMDPLGFGLENFDGIGRWRDQDNKQKIDPSGVLPDGASFAGPAGLRKVLVGKADQFRRCLAEKLSTYALGRGMEYPDKCLLDDAATKLKAGGDRFSALVLAVVESDAFQKRKGKRSD
jgi:hypothetical protein